MAALRLGSGSDSTPLSDQLREVSGAFSARLPALAAAVPNTDRLASSAKPPRTAAVSAGKFIFDGASAAGRMLAGSSTAQVKRPSKTAVIATNTKVENLTTESSVKRATSGMRSPGKEIGRAHV